jgi:5-methylcytosine-specific restriction endonuclease McrA
VPWFRLDDSFHSHPKVIAVGNEAVGLYVRCGTYAAQHLTDGFVPEDVVLLYGSAELAGALVRAKLWRRARGGWQMHDYLRYNPTREAVENERRTNARRQALFRDAGLKAAIRQRDGDACRYCGIKVRWGKGQAPDSGTYDHVDPYGSNTLPNLVVACLSCNARKRDRTPAEAGMSLLSPPAEGASVEASREAYSERSQEALPTRPDPYSYTGPFLGGRHARTRDPKPDLQEGRANPADSAAGRHPSAQPLAAALEAAGLNGSAPAGDDVISRIASEARQAITAITQEATDATA